MTEKDCTDLKSPITSQASFNISAEWIANVSHLTKLVDHITSASSMHSIFPTLLSTLKALWKLFSKWSHLTRDVAVQLHWSRKCSLIHNSDYDLKRRPVQIYVFCKTRRNGCKQKQLQICSATFSPLSSPCAQQERTTNTICSRNYVLSPAHFAGITADKCRE